MSGPDALRCMLVLFHSLRTIHRTLSCRNGPQHVGHVVLKRALSPERGFVELCGEAQHPVHVVFAMFSCHGLYGSG